MSCCTVRAGKDTGPCFRFSLDQGPVDTGRLLTSPAWRDHRLRSGHGFPAFLMRLALVLIVRRIRTRFAGCSARWDSLHVPIGIKPDQQFKHGFSESESQSVRSSSPSSYLYLIYATLVPATSAVSTRIATTACFRLRMDEDCC